MSEGHRRTRVVGDKTSTDTMIQYDYDYEPSGDILSSDLFHGVVWMLLTVGIIGNVLVVVWRLTQKKDRKTSPLSILIIMLSVSDLLYCLHLLLLESLVADSSLGESKLWGQISTAYLCLTSGCLSLFSCFTAQWATFNIAVYSFQAITAMCSRCCCSLLRKRCLIITITFQILLAVAAVVVIFLPLPYVGFVPWDVDEFQNDYIQVFHSENLTIYSRVSRSTQISEIFGQCAWTQSTGYDVCIKGSGSDTDGNHTTTFNYTECGAASNFNLSGTVTTSIYCVLTLTCAVLYLLVCLKVWTTEFQSNTTPTQRSDIHNLQWRLSVIILLNTLCWIPATVLHWMEDFVIAQDIIASDFWSNKSTAATVLLISISPAVNPFIYTLTGNSFLQSICKYRRRLKCDISMRRSNCHDDPITGVERCSCIPCVKCVHRFEDFDTLHPNTVNTNLKWSSSESSETT